MSTTRRCRRLAGAAVFALLASLIPAQVQPNSPPATLLVNGQTGHVGALQGDYVQAMLAGGPNKAVLYFTGGLAVPGIPTIAGTLNVDPFLGFLVNGIEDPLAVTDATGIFTRSYQIPWLAPLGTAITTQGAIEDLNAPAGFTLTAPSTVHVGSTLVSPAHLYFDPRTGARGVDNLLPPAGTLPGDLPTLTAYGFEGPTNVYYGEDPVHGVLQAPQYCYVCHGAVPEIFGSYMGTMMANAARDPLFHGQFAISVAGMEMLKQQGYSWIGGELAADACIRCHSPNGWLSGRSSFQGNGTTSAYEPAIFDEQHALDREGVVCDTCHRTTGFAPNRSPSAFAVPGQPDNGQLVLSPTLTKFGPFPGTTQAQYLGGATPYGAHVPPVAINTMPPVAHFPPVQEGTAISPGHDTEQSAFVRDSRLCGSCHNVTNPINGHAVERTYTEWLQSDFGNPQSPAARTCQECHMPPAQNKRACALGGIDPVYGQFDKIRSIVRRHEFVGGNAWIPQILKQMYPLVDLNWAAGLNYMGLGYYGPPDRSPWWDATSAAAVGMLRSAASLDLTATEAAAGTVTAQVRITNLSGHKLPTGYPEGRRMWIHIQAKDAGGITFFQSGVLDSNSELIPDPMVKVYEAKHGLHYPAYGLSGPSFHFLLNNDTVKDNRILPQGAVQVRGVGGTDSYDPVLAPAGGLYPDGQNWDLTTYTIAVPPGTPRPIRVSATVYYQTSSFAYVDFLANGGDATVTTAPHPDAVTLRNLWQNGYPAPAIAVGTVGAASTQDPGSATPDQTALVVVP